MLKRFFFGKKKGGAKTGKGAEPAFIDQDETIVINLTGKDAVDPAEIRVEFDGPPEAPRGLSPSGGGPPGTAGSPVEPPSVPRLAPDDETTRIWRAGGAAPRAADPDPGGRVAETRTDTTPRVAADLSVTAGWLLITSGNERGRLFAVRLGRNKVGRSATNEICIDNGDTAISKQNHMTIAADPKTRRYFLVPGDSTNLAYVDEEPLLEPRELADKATIQLGETKLIFIQLCGNYVDWS